VATSDDVELLISELSASLAPSQQHYAFEAAARAVLAATNCSGCGAAYRLLAPVQAEPIGAPDPREGARDRRRLRLAR